MFKKTTHNILTHIVVVMLIAVWLFSGWPSLQLANWVFPPAVEEAKAVSPAFESGEVTITDSLSWTTITLSNSYTTAPVILAVPVTAANCEASTCAGNDSTGGYYPLALIRNVTTTDFDISMCVDGGNAACSTGVSSETFNWFAFDVDDAGSYDWIEAGTTTGVSVGGGATAETYSTSFASAPNVWTQAQTYSQGSNIGAHAWVNPSNLSGFSYIGCVHTGAADACDGTASTETFGYVAIDLVNEAFDSGINFQSGSASIANSLWTAASFSPSYTNARVMVTQDGESGGQDPEYPWARSVTTTGMDFRYCEQDAATVCNSHNAETVYWFAIEQQSSNQSPDAPTLHDTPFDNQKTTDTTLDIEFTGSDPDGVADIIYHIQIDDDYAFGSLLVNCESDIACASGSGSFANTITGGDTNPFNEGERIRFTSTTSMASGTTYYWRVRAEDDSGIYGNWTSIQSVTFVSGTASPEWFQTADEQFDIGTLASTVTYFDSVQLQGSVGEYGTAILTNNTASTVNLNNVYENLVVVASPRHSPSTDAQRVARIMSKASGSFNIKVDNYAGSLTATTTVDWIAMEAGSWVIDDGGTGIKAIAGTKSTAIQSYNGNFPVGTSVTFNPNFDAAPAVLHNIASNNDTSWTASMVNDGTQTGEVTATGMNVTLNTSWDTVSHGTAEDIDYVAIDTGHGTNNSVEFDVARGQDFSACCNTTGYAASFSSSFSTTPEVYVVSQMGENGGNGAYAVTHTGTAVSTTEYYSSTDEDGPSADRTHAAETVSVLAFDATSGNILPLGIVASGTIMSPEIDYDWVSGQSSWNEAKFSTTENNGDVKVSVYYTVSTACDTIIPDGALTGNSTGFDVSASPIDISGLSTVTYNRICLEATVTDVGGTAFLNDWTVTWSSNTSTYTQNDFEWFIDQATVSLTDPHPSGALDLAENAVLDNIPFSNSPLASGGQVRLQMNLTIADLDLGAASQSFQLEYDTATDCTTATGWAAVGGIGSGTIWRLFDNTSLTDGATEVNQISTSDIAGDYSESNPSQTNPNSVSIAQDVEWDWPIENNGASTNTTYCFRMVKSGGTALDTYNADSYPKLRTAPSTADFMRHGNFFNDAGLEQGFYWAN